MSSADPIPVIVEELARLLRLHGRTMATIESCTGGLVAAALTDLSGISDVFVGGFVTYSDELKQRAVGVQLQTLGAHGAVSSQAAIEMAVGGAINAGATDSIAITGIAGPSGGTPDKPVGTVWICIAHRAMEPLEEGGTEIHAEIDCRRFVLGGDRAAVRRHATIAALSMGVQMLSGEQRDLQHQAERVGA